MTLNDEHSQRKFREYISFFLLPLLGTMLRVPTLQDAQMNRLHPFSFQHMNSDYLLRNFSYSKAGDRWWTAVTYMWLHGDAQHLQSNIMVLLPAGYAVTKQFSVWHCWGVFLGGGIFAALEGWGLRDYQDQQQLATMLALPKQLGALSAWWDRGVKRVAPVLAKYTKVFMGCSAGVSALQGMNVAVWVEQLVRGDAGPASAAMALNLVSMLTYYTAEFSKVSSGEWSRIDHAGHIAGFCFGIGCFGLSKAVSYLSNRKSKTKRR